MPSRRPPKKNDTIEIRVSDEVKLAFAERCRRDDHTVSEAIRSFMADQLAARPAPRARPAALWRMLVAAIVGAGLGIGVAAPSFAMSSPATRAAFDRLDRDGNGVLTYAEYRAR